MGLQIFINYVHEDRDRVRDLSERLKEEGIEPWLDTHILAGQDWLKEIQNAINNSVAILAVFSSHRDALTSRGADQELVDVLARRARGEGFLIPVRLDPTGIPDEVRHLMSCDLFAENGWELMIRSIRHLAKNRLIGNQFESIKPPAPLIEACLNDECVLYAGAGLSASSGLPTWKPLMRKLIEWADSERLIEPENLATMYSLEHDREWNLLADKFVRSLQKVDQEPRLYEQLSTIVDAPDVQLSERHRLLGEINFSAVLTTNFDSLLEETFEYPPERVLTPQDSEALLDVLSKREFFISKLFGRLEDLESLIFAPSQYEDVISGNQVFADFIENLFLSRTLLFMGCSLDGIEGYLEGITFRNNNRRHFALVAVSDSVWEVKAETLKARYGIEVLPYLETSDHPEVDAFISDLLGKTTVSKVEKRKSGSRRSSKTGQSRGLLRELHLENIGQFDQLSMTFDPQWTILLGDNGVGKSTVLKAIALAFCGEQAREYADRILNYEKNNGQIILRTEREVYTTLLTRTSHGVQIKSSPGRPLDHESWLSLGFPSLRYMSWRPIRELVRENGKKRQVAEDLLPLLTGEPDPRLDDLKDWLYSLNSWSYQTGRANSETFGRIRDSVFRILSEIAENTEISYARDHSEATDHVMVSFQGKEIPIEVLSQGTASLFGWLGVLLRRLYRVYENDPDAMQRPALVLIDEIDAHMHPVWQQSIVLKLQKLFPNLQFVATSHSPLVVSNLTDGAIYRIERVPQDRSFRARKLQNPAGYGVSGLLTSDFFGLPTEFDQKTQLLLDEKALLTAKQKLTDEEKKRCEAINDELDRHGLLTPYSDPYYQAFLRALERRNELQTIRKRRYTAEDLARHQEITDEILKELETEGLM